MVKMPDYRVLGTDISNNFVFDNGDIELTTGIANLSQAIYNRLKTPAEFYSTFYSKYGGDLEDHLGDFNIPTIHEYIRIEIESIISQESRVQEIVECTVNKTSSSSVNCTLKVRPIGDDDVVAFNLVLNADSEILIVENYNDMS